MKSSDLFQNAHFGRELTVLPMQVSIAPKGDLQEWYRCAEAFDLGLHILHPLSHNYYDTYSPSFPA